MADKLRLEIVPVDADAGGGFQVLAHVNGVEMTAAGAGLGMDPYELLVPVNRLVATPHGHTVPIARCECGEYGCGSTDVTITRDGNVVRWHWAIEAPMTRAAVFAAGDYDAEVARVVADRSWETPERTAGRLVWEGADAERLRALGFRLGWVGNDYRDPETFAASLVFGRHQVFLETPWSGRSAADVARDVCDILALPPERWAATWRPMVAGDDTPPPLAGPAWRRATDRLW